MREKTLEEINEMTAKNTEVEYILVLQCKIQSLESQLAQELEKAEKLREALRPFASQAKFHIRRGSSGTICNNCGFNYPCDIVLAQEALLGRG